MAIYMFTDKQIKGGRQIWGQWSIPPEEVGGLKEEVKLAEFNQWQGHDNAVNYDYMSGYNAGYGGTGEWFIKLLYQAYLDGYTNFTFERAGHVRTTLPILLVFPNFETTVPQIGMFNTIPLYPTTAEVAYLYRSGYNSNFASTDLNISWRNNTGWAWSDNGIYCNVMSANSKFITYATLYVS